MHVRNTFRAVFILPNAQLAACSWRHRAALDAAAARILGWGTAAGAAAALDAAAAKARKDAAGHGSGGATRVA